MEKKEKPTIDLNKVDVQVERLYATIYKDETTC